MKLMLSVTAPETANREEVTSILQLFITVDKERRKEKVVTVLLCFCLSDGDNVG